MLKVATVSANASELPATHSLGLIAVKENPSLLLKNKNSEKRNCVRSRSARNSSRISALRYPHESQQMKVRLCPPAHERQMFVCLFARLFCFLFNLTPNIFILSFRNETLPSATSAGILAVSCDSAVFA